MRTVRVGDFEWDPVKARENARKHRVTFVEAMSVFLDPLALDLTDQVHSGRWTIIGRSRGAGTLFVVYVEREQGAILRIISARDATASERREYEEEA